MPKVLHIVNRFNIGGLISNATLISRFLPGDFETLLIGGYPEKGESDSLFIPREYGVEPILIDEMKREINFSQDYKAYKTIRKIIEEFKPDIVHTHASKAGAIGRRAAFACKVPIVVHTFHGHAFHSYFGNLKTSFYKLIERKLARKTTGIVAISEIQKHELSEIHSICPKEKIRVIPYGFDLTKFQSDKEEKRTKIRTQYQLEEGEIAVAIIGRLAPIKNHSFFFQIVRGVLEQKIEKVKFFVVGGGELHDEVEAETKQINETFGEKVIMTSWIRDIENFVPAMDIICLTSNNEGAPLSLIEAQASNVAVISTNVGGVRDIMLDGETGFVIEKGDLKEYVEKLVILIENDEIRRKMSQNGWTYVRDKFHYTRLVKDVEDYYRELLSKLK